MELIFTDMKHRIIILLAGVLLTALSCNKIVTYKTDYPDKAVNNGAPSITAIYDLYDSKLETPLEEGALAQILHITGKNLANPVSVTFNGIAANLDQCFCENQDAYIVVPRVLPSEVNNKLVFTTDQGSVSFPFGVKIPQLKLDGLKNEFALPGSTVAVNGDFFDLFGFGTEGSDASIMLGETPVEVAEVSETGMSIVIPETAPDNSVITFSWTDVTLGAQSKDIPYRRVDALFLGDFSGIGFWDDKLKVKHLTDGTADGDPVSPGFPFLRFNTAIGAWTWYSLGMGGDFPLDFDWEKEMDNLVFKCEFWTNAAKPIPAYTAGGIMVQFNTKANVALDLEGAAVNTGGEWVTFSWPLSSVASEMPAQGVYWNFAFTVQPPIDWNVDFAMSNPRIEPANY